MSHPLRVLILSKDPTFFSTADVAVGDTLKRHLKYAECLRAKYPGSEITIITYTPRTVPGSQTFQSDGFQLYGTRSSHRVTYLWDLILRIRQVLASGWCPHVVTAQTPWEEGVVGLLLARGLRARFVSQLHFDLFSEDWAREHWLNRWRRKVATSVLKRSSMIRVVSSTQAYKLAKSLGLPEEQLRVVPVGVHFEPAVGTGGEFKEALAPSLSRHLVVLFVGRFVPAKDLNLWVRVAELIAQHRPDVAFVLAGSGPLEKSIRDLVEKKGLLDRFHFLGAVAHKDLPSVYAAADLFLLSSSNEGFGRVILEAALAGVAVVSTSCAGPADLVEHGETGILCPVGDAGALATAALSLLGDESLRHRLSKAARFRVRENYNSEALTERLVACWADA